MDIQKYYWTSRSAVAAKNYKNTFKTIFWNFCFIASRRIGQIWRSLLGIYVMFHFVFIREIVGVQKLSWLDERVFVKQRTASLSVMKLSPTLNQFFLTKPFIHILQYMKHDSIVCRDVVHSCYKYRISECVIVIKESDVRLLFLREGEHIIIGSESDRWNY